MAGVSAATASKSSPAIQTMPVQSNFMAALEYDETNLTLTTHMKNGAIYQHKFVTPADWAALQTSQNSSKHWADNIQSKKASVRIKAAKAPKSEIKKKGENEMPDTLEQDLKEIHAAELEKQAKAAEERRQLETNVKISHNWKTAVAAGTFPGHLALHIATLLEFLSTENKKAEEAFQAAFAQHPEWGRKPGEPA